MVEFQTLTEDTCWQAVCDSDRRYDGIFITVVHSTGIYCRPSCSARLPKRENVSFVATCSEAEAAGYRACKRCRPNERDYELAIAETICRYIEANNERQPSLAELSRQVYLSTSQMHRIFKRTLGITPYQYIDACRVNDFTDRLRAGESITEALYNAGYGSSSRVYERVPEQIGMTPSQYQQGGKGVHIRYSIVDSALGRLLVGMTERGICGVSLSDSDDELIEFIHKAYPTATITEAAEPTREVITRLLRYLDGEEPRLDLPIDIRMTAFQRRVMDELRTIPYGEQRTYSQVAESIGQPTAVRAVARVCATNPVPLVIPCHRVTRKDGSLAGYRWGIERKAKLLEMEKENTGKV